MKKIILVLTFAFFAVFSGFAQLHTQTVEEARDYKIVYSFYMGGGCIRYIDSSYVLLGTSKNQFENTMHSIYLGDDKNSAIQSLKDLENLKKTIKKPIVVKGAGGKNTTIDKLMGCVTFTTDGVAGYSEVLFALKTNKAIEAIQSFKE